MKKLSLIFILFFFINNVSAAHYIVGIVNNARDGTSANDRTVVLWNPDVGIQDNVTDIVGLNGNSGVNNVYMIDCELLNDSCKPGNDLLIMVLDNGEGYIGYNASVKVTGRGYDTASNISLNSPPNFTSLLVDDAILNPLNEIDLVSSTTRLVTCEAFVNEADGSPLLNITSQLYDINTSFYGDLDDNNYHYTNNSCYVDQSYSGPTQKRILCSYDVWYYANNHNWSCNIRVEDNRSTTDNMSDGTYINQLLSINLLDVVDYTPTEVLEVSLEKIINITNYGNTMINISLSGYGSNEYDNLSLDCRAGVVNISINYEKYNLTTSNPGNITLSEFESKYTNLTSYPKVKSINFDYRHNDSLNEAIRNSYWRIYVPLGTSGNCRGYIIFSAVVAPGE